MPDSQIDFSTNKGVRIIFPKQTPFVERNGNEIYSFTVGSMNGRKLKVRQDDQACMSAPGCKYIVSDRSNPGRPPLDPYIIIGR
ncbi:MAG: hypothetical protein RQ741_12115 [Wenzhouxiangellaceae bacterium]|nr:hypothetical protein [Wenzhouxiangellaceae bacterium]